MKNSNSTPKLRHKSAETHINVERERERERERVKYFLLLICLLFTCNHLLAQQQAPQTEFEAEFYMESEIMQGIYSKCKVSQSSPDCPDTASFCIAYTCEDEFLSFSGHYAAVPNAASITFTSVPGTLEFYDFNFNFLAINTITFYCTRISITKFII